MRPITQLLEQAHQGDPRAARALLPLVYDELRRLAAARLAREPAGQTLDATSLVHEAYLRLVGPPPTDGRDADAAADDDAATWNGRGHFFAAAAQAMRRILVERARRKRAVKHGGGRAVESLPDDDDLPLPEPREDLVALDEALDLLAQHDAAKARLVTLRYFVGLTLAEAAAVLGISEATADRHWAYARAWLHHAMKAAE